MWSTRHRAALWIVAFCLFCPGRSSRALGASDEIVSKINAVYGKIALNATRENKKILSELIDRAVLEHLNSGNSPSSLPGLFSQLPDDERSTEEPSYSAMPMRIGGRRYVLGLYRFGYSFCGQGRLSVYALHGRSWSRTDVFDGICPLLLYFFPSALSRGYVLTLERFMAADHQEADIVEWLVRDGKLVRQRGGCVGLIDGEVATAPSSLTVSYSRYAKNLCEGDTGERLLYELAFRLDKKGKMAATKRCLTPWLEVWNECFGCIRANNVKKGIRCVEAKSTFMKLRRVYRGYCPWISSQSGDAKKGVAYVQTPAESDEDKAWRIGFKRKNGRWYIASVTEVEKNG